MSRRPQRSRITLSSRTGTKNRGKALESYGVQGTAGTNGQHNLSVADGVLANGRIRLLHPRFICTMVRRVIHGLLIEYSPYIYLVSSSTM